MTGSIYERQSKPKSTKRKGRKIVNPVSKKAKLEGSGDYTYRYKGKTPFADAARHMGSYFGYGDMAAAVGHGIGRIIGSGDYETGPMVKSNVLVNSTEVPQFEGLGRGNVVMHREYIGDVITSSTIGGFKNDSYTINPGNDRTFPWLSTIAQNYEQYKIHGMIFMFKSTSGESVASTNTALGTVIMATDYNVNAPAYRTKNEMEQSQFAQSFKSAASAIHGIECAKDEIPINAFYIRTGAVPANDSIKWYDLANFQIATQGFQAASVNIGEIWVSYLVEFLKPQVPFSIGGTVNSQRIVRSDLTNAAPLGLIPNSSTGNLSVATNSTSVAITSVTPGQLYLVEMAWACTTAVAWTPPVLAFTGCDPQLLGPARTTGVPYTVFEAPGSGASSNEFYQSVTVKVLPGATQFIVSVPSWVGPVNVSNRCTIFVTQLDNAIE